MKLSESKLKYFGNTPQTTIPFLRYWHLFIHSPLWILIMLFDSIVFLSYASYGLEQNLFVIVFGVLSGWKIYEFISKQDWNNFHRKLPEIVESNQNAKKIYFETQIECFNGKLKMWLLFAPAIFFIMDLNLLFRERSLLPLFIGIFMIAFWRRGADTEQVVLAYLAISGRSLPTIAMALSAKFSFSSDLKNTFESLSRSTFTVTRTTVTSSTKKQKRKSSNKEFYHFE